MSKKRGAVLLYFRSHWRGVVAFLFVLVACGGGSYFFPLELMEVRSRVDLWSAGIREVDFPNTQPRLHGYMRNQCDSSKNSADCVCVAFLHGLGDNALTWRKILETRHELWEKLGFVRPQKFLALDLPGSGGSEPAKNADQYRARNQAHTVIQALKSVCGQWVVVGNSLGGWIATWVALEWPEGVTRLLLLAPGGFKHSETTVRLLADPTVESLKEFQNKAYYKSRVIPEYLWAAIVRKARGGKAKEIAQAQKEEDYLEGRFTTLRIPTLLFWGVEDHIIPIEQGRQIRDQLHSSVWREVPECGHLLHKECPLPIIQGIVDLTNYGAM